MVLKLHLKNCSKITSVCKPKNKGKEKDGKTQEIYIAPEKRQQIIDGLRFFQAFIKIKYQIENHKHVRQHT